MPLPVNPPSGTGRQTRFHQVTFAWLPNCSPAARLCKVDAGAQHARILLLALDENWDCSPGFGLGGSLPLQGNEVEPRTVNLLNAFLAQLYSTDYSHPVKGATRGMFAAMKIMTITCLFSSQHQKLNNSRWPFLAIVDLVDVYNLILRQVKRNDMIVFFFFLYFFFFKTR